MIRGLRAFVKHWFVYLQRFMKIYQTLQKGEYHLTHCEDYAFTGSIGEDIIVSAVMDGCTMGDDSYLASTITGKLLRKITTSAGYRELYNKQPLYADTGDYLKHILQNLFEELKLVKNLLLLGKNELLTTIILLVLNKKHKNGTLLAIGDGVVSINGGIRVFEQDNKPDYIGYHLSEDFDDWYSHQQQKINLINIKDISIATDGIETFTPFHKKDDQGDINPLEMLMVDNINNESEDILDRKLKQLEHIHGLKPTDDLALIRIIC